jgi:hypothetical protein
VVWVEMLVVVIVFVEDVLEIVVEVLVGHAIPV